MTVTRIHKCDILNDMVPAREIAASYMHVGAICGFCTCKLLATNMLVKFYMNVHRQHTIQLRNKQPTHVNHTGVFAFTQIS